MQFVQFLFWFLYFFVKFTKFSHHVHNLFIIGWYTLDTVKEEIRLPDNKAYKINFFIIAQAPKGVWALLILWGFSCHPITVLTIKKNLACEILRLRRVAFATYFITAAVRSLRSIFNSYELKKLLSFVLHRQKLLDYLDVTLFNCFSSSLFWLMASISSFRDSILASRSDTILAHSTSSFLMLSGASPSNL